MTLRRGTIGLEESKETALTQAAFYFSGVISCRGQRLNQGGGLHEDVMSPTSRSVPPPRGTRYDGWRKTGTPSGALPTAPFASRLGVQGTRQSSASLKHRRCRIYPPYASRGLSLGPASVSQSVGRHHDTSGDKTLEATEGR